MNPGRYLGELFEDEPTQWGLRGDPYLWREFRAYFENAPMPRSAALLEEEIALAFLLVTGRPMSSPDAFSVDSLAHGGMSSGGISPEFWREKLLPLLRERYAESG